MVCGRGQLAIAVLLSMSVAGCGLMPGMSLDEAPEGCGFPPGTELAFSGQGSVWQLGLENAENLRGNVYVTAQLVQLTAPPGTPPPQRVYCVQHVRNGEEFFSMGPVREDWAPPSPPS